MKQAVNCLSLLTFLSSLDWVDWAFDARFDQRKVCHCGRVGCLDVLQTF